MEQLPDDILLLVFRALDAKPLLSVVRAVCRRWRELALDRDAWSHRRVSTDLVTWWEGKLLKRILQVAPCISQLEIKCDHFEDEKDNEELLNLLQRTPCSVKTLYIFIDIDGYNSVCEGIVSNQIEKGNLRGVIWRDQTRQTELENIVSLVKDLHLSELGLEREDAHDTLLMELPELGKGSVKILRYEGHVDDNLLLFLLRSYAQSVESVYISVRRGYPCFFGSCLSCLPNCVNLTRVYLNPPLQELNCLRDCPKLSHLHLNFFRLYSEERLEPSALTSYFQSAEALRLTSLEFSFDIEHTSSFNLLVACISALAENEGSSALEEFVLSLSSEAFCTFPQEIDVPDLDRLAVLLPSFPCLRRLELDVQAYALKLPAKLRDCLRPGVLPQLRTLTVRGSISSHTPYFDLEHLIWIVRGNPWLEVNVKPWFHTAYFKPVTFRSCRQPQAEGMGSTAEVAVIYR